MKYIYASAAAIALFASLPFMTAKAQTSRVQEETMYRILVDRFNNGDPKNDGKANPNDPYSRHGGDLKGIIDKLDLIESFGITTIVLSPIMKNAENGYQGYLTEDFTKVDPHFGTEREWKQLLNRAHSKNIKIILEMAPNYISKTNTIASDPRKSTWFKAERPNGKEKWKEQAFMLDLNNTEVGQMLKESALHWLVNGADGFLIHDADEMPQDFLSDFSNYLKTKNNQFYIMASTQQDTVAKPDLSTVKELDAILDSASRKDLDDRLGRISGKLPEKPFSDRTVLHVDGPDSPRFAQIAGENGRNAATAWKLALVYMYATSGVPMIYQGSELPMYGKTPEEVRQLVDFNSGDPELKEYFERLGALRKQFPALSTGDFEIVGNDHGLQVLKRSDEQETLYIAINNDDRSRAYSIKDEEKGKQLKGLLGDNLVRADKEGRYTITLPRETAEIYVVKEDQGINWALIIFIIGVMLVFIVSIAVLSRKQKKRA